MWRSWKFAMRKQQLRRLLQTQVGCNVNSCYPVYRRDSSVITFYSWVQCCGGGVSDSQPSLTHTRSTASNLEQVAILLCAQANSASYPQDGKWVVAMATEWRLMVCLLATPWVQLSIGVGNGWPHNALRHHWLMPISCLFWDCKVLLVTSLTHVSGTVTSLTSLI